MHWLFSIYDVGQQCEAFEDDKVECRSHECVRALSPTQIGHTHGHIHRTGFVFVQGSAQAISEAICKHSISYLNHRLYVMGLTYMYYTRTTDTTIHLSIYVHRVNRLQQHTEAIRTLRPFLTSMPPFLTRNLSSSHRLPLLHPAHSHTHFVPCTHMRAARPRYGRIVWVRHIPSMLFNHAADQRVRFLRGEGFLLSIPALALTVILPITVGLSLRLRLRLRHRVHLRLTHLHSRRRPTYAHTYPYPLSRRRRLTLRKGQTAIKHARTCPSPCSGIPRAGSRCRACKAAGNRPSRLVRLEPLPDGVESDEVLHARKEDREGDIEGGYELSGGDYARWEGSITGIGPAGYRCGGVCGSGRLGGSCW